MSIPRLPDFVAVGPQRTGTSWLDEMLRGHLGLPEGAKETDFFVRHYARGIDWYLDYFRNCPASLPIGEIDPNYFGSVEARDRIARQMPQCRIICSFRDPTARAYSSYRVMRRDAWTRVGFEETVTRNAIMRESSRYAHHLAEWQRMFGPERVLVCLYDDLEADAQAYLDRICSFIGIASVKVDGKAAAERVNAVSHAPRSRRLAQNARNARDWMLSNRWHRTFNALERAGVWDFCFGGGAAFQPLDPEAEARMREHFRPEVEALERMIGRDLSSWKHPRAVSAPPRQGAGAGRSAVA
ncbi:MAG: sulfotransferase family protein [Candidatus Binatus sp.]